MRIRIGLAPSFVPIALVMVPGPWVVVALLARCVPSLGHNSLDEDEDGVDERLRGEVSTYPPTI